MCYPLPGPLCSAHARAALEAASFELKQATDTAEMQASLAGTSSPSYRRAVQAQVRAQRQYDKADVAWQRTPEGLAQLARAYRQAISTGDSIRAQHVKNEWTAAYNARKQSLYDLQRVQAITAKERQINTFVRSLPDTDKTNLLSVYANGTKCEVGVVLSSPTSEQMNKWRAQLDNAGLKDAKIQAVYLRQGVPLRDDPDLIRKERLESDPLDAA